MPDRLSLKYTGAAFLVAVSFCVSSPAMAGFQWIAPSDAASAPPMGLPPEMMPPPQVQQAAPQPVAPVASPEVISPLVITGGANGSTTQAPDNTGVVGFAKGVPLAVALRQILPIGYGFSIDQDVDMGTLVSFQGGHPWRDTLRTALAPAGLVMREDGQMVSVGFSHSLAAQAGAQYPTYQAGLGPKNLAASAPADSVIMPVPEEAIKLEPSKGSDSAVAEAWQAERGQYLRKILEDWCRRSNVEFNWLSEYDYPLQASVSFSNGFENAVRSLLTGFENAHPQPVAELHSNPNINQMVLVVRTRGNSNND